MPVRVVGFDGDDTLWHSETRFHVTQGEFRELLQRHVPEADADARLAEMEMKNLSIYGYGVKSFTLSMLETAIELTAGRIPTSDLEVILGWGKRMLMEPTKLLDGVEKTLRDLGGRYERPARPWSGREESWRRRPGTPATRRRPRPPTAARTA